MTDEQLEPQFKAWMIAHAVWFMIPPATYRMFQRCFTYAYELGKLESEAKNS